MLIAYLTITACGFTILMITMLLGGGDEADFDVDHDIDFDHDFEMDADIDGDFDHDVGGGHHFFSLRVISVFITSFGAGGSIGRLMDLSQWPSLGLAFGCGITMGLIADFIMIMLLKQQASSAINIDQLKGKRGVVTLGIPPGRIGEVQVQLGSTTVNRSAKCENDDIELKQGDHVIIVQHDPQPMIVKKAE